MNELQDNIMDIKETLNTDVIQFDNNELAHELNEFTLTEPNIIAMFPVVPVAIVLEFCQRIAMIKIKS